MENNVSIISKRVWSMIRVALFMLRKGISKGKLMMDLNMVVKRRGKLAGKAFTNLMFPHHRGGSTSSSRSHNEKRLSTAREYEFSCSNTPSYKFTLNNKSHRNNHFFACAHAPLKQDNDIATVNMVKAVLENIVNDNVVMAEASPVLVRVSDSPFPLHDIDVEVDKAAEAFIKRFYLQLGKQD